MNGTSEKGARFMIHIEEKNKNLRRFSSLLPSQKQLRQWNDEQNTGTQINDGIFLISAKN